MTVHYTSISSGQDRQAVLTHGGKFNTPPQHLYQKVFKRFLDVLFVVLALPVVLPVVLVLAVLVAKDGANPFYGQRRVGRNGQIFTMWKLRSMVPNADALLEEHLSKSVLARREWEVTQKLRDDPRITPIGKLVRKTSLDELPQLWNVLTGEMSLVGPRPMMPEQRKLYPGTAYLALRPGLTGLWQISERNASSFASRAEYDATYAQDLSLKTDMGILMATVGVVIRATGY